VENELQQLRELLEVQSKQLQEQNALLWLTSIPRRRNSALIRR
jgi:hypothetical protein